METESSVLIEGTESELMDYVRNVFLGINNETCGFIRRISGSKLQLIKDSDGPEIGKDGTGSCTHSRYEPIIWHTHPNNVKRFYPSVEDIVKILKEPINESFIFCKYGLWNMVFRGTYSDRAIGDIPMIKSSQEAAEPYKNTLGYSINYLNTILDEKIKGKLKGVTDGNLGPYIMEYIMEYCDSLNTMILERFSGNFIIKFTSYEEVEVAHTLTRLGRVEPGGKKRRRSKKSKKRRKSKRRKSKRRKSKKTNR